ncbi:MAG: TIGR04255 family protein [Spirochaetaceae bacterium]|nr:TIGR04255 family protein [Spirochaetaceae bacterium]
MPPDFRNPPINEVVIATYFSSPISALRTEHIGLFWAKIRQDFPSAVQRPPVPMEEPTPGTEVFPAPRYWFVARDDASLLQLQKGAFMFNWRRREAAYPRFHILKPQFDKYYDLFINFARAELQCPEPSIDLCELTYVNAIHTCEYWTGPSDTPNVIPSFPLIDPGPRNPVSTGFTSTFAFETDIDVLLNVGIRSGTTVEEPIVPILLFEIKATAKLDSATKLAADSWFDRAHAAVMDCFIGMTDSNIQRQHWKRVEPPPDG